MRPSLKRVFAGGIAGTVGATLVFYLIAPMLAGGPLDIAFTIESTLGVPWGVGMALHLLIGTFLIPLGYFAMYTWLRGRPWMKGLLYGVGVWIVAEAVVAPITGGGFFHTALGGGMIILASLIGHLVYGLLLGSVAGLAVESDTTRHVTADPEREQRAMTEPN